MRQFICCLLILGLTTSAFSQSRPTTSLEPLSDRIVAYEIEASLNPETKMISGTERITWRNTSNNPVDELQLHLYLNAFKNERTTFMQEGGGGHRGFSANSENPWGWIDIDSMKVLIPDVVTELAYVPLPDSFEVNVLPDSLAGQNIDSLMAFNPLDKPDSIASESLIELMQNGGAPLSSNTTFSAGQNLTDLIQFIRPDDDNQEDQTVVSVKLAEAVPAGGQITVEIKFTAKLPEIVARTGWYQKDNDQLFFMVAQWFPKLGVYEVPGQRYVPADAPEGKWNTHQFHANSEFYADYGTFEVEMTVPEAYKIGSSGLRVSEKTENGLRTAVYRAEDVHDFAWTTSNDFLEYTDHWNHVTLRLMLQPEHKDQAQRHFDAAKVGLEYFDRLYGEYPYTTLTLVDGMGGSNGMEYPTLITCGTRYGLPDWLRALETVTIHEFGHQYWYGLVGSNEFEETWLDEGFNTYSEIKVMDAAYQNGSMLSFPGLRIDDEDIHRLSYTQSAPTRGAIYTRSWEYEWNEDYGKCSYSKPGIVLLTLERYIGEEKMGEVMRTWYQRWRFKHPSTRDFVNLVNEVTGDNLNWFFDAYVYGEVAVDYAVVKISNNEIVAQDAGVFDRGGERVNILPEDPDEKIYESKVRLQRKEEGIFPQLIRFTFEDGATVDTVWAGGEVWKEFTFSRPARMAEAWIDPDNNVPLDINKLNNRMTLDPQDDAASKMSYSATVLVQQLYYLLIGLF